MIHSKFNSNFKSHIIFKRTKETIVLILELLPMNKRQFSCPSASQQTHLDGVVTNQILLCQSCFKLKL
jgi:hypothetical protein